MKLKRTTVLLALFLLMAVPGRAQQGDPIAVVVSPKNSVANLTVAELRKFFSGEKRTWPGGEPVRLFVRSPGTPERGALLRLLAMSEDDYKRYWTAQVFRGESQNAPVTLPSSGMQREAVGAFPGALVLVSLQDVRPGMKVVKIDGHLPGEPGYPLH